MEEALKVETGITGTVDAAAPAGSQNGDARAAPPSDQRKLDEQRPPIRKRKTRRGKSKRKAPYQKFSSSSKSVKPRIIKPEAPHNDNQFLFEDHEGFKELDERLKNIDQVSIRTRESSFSVESEEFYSSPDDEDEFLMQDFNAQYHSVQIEQLQKMDKETLIEEYIALDNLISQKKREFDERVARLQKDLEEEITEKEMLQQENELLRSKLEKKDKPEINSDSADSETDSSDSDTSSSTVSSTSDASGTSAVVNYPCSNGHGSSPPTNVDAVQ